MQMTIARRLGCMLSAALLALLVVGGTGIYSAHDMSGDIRDTNSGTLRALDLLGQAESSFILIRMNVLYHLSSDQSDKQAQYAAAIRQKHQDVRKSLEAYEKELAKEPRDQALLLQDQQLLANYMLAVDKILTLSQSREQQTALQLLEKELKPAGELLTRSLAAHREINQQRARDMTQHLLDDCQRNTLLTLLVSLAAVALLASSGWLLARSIGRSLRGLRQTMLSIETSLDFSCRAEVMRRDEIGETATAFNHLLERLQHSLREVSAHTEQVAGAAGGMASLSQQVASSSENQSAAAANMAAAIEEMSVSIGQAGERALEAQQASRQSGDLATQGEHAIVQTVREINLAADVVLQAESQIQRLDTDSTRISNVIAVIKEVAEQTNLLALNAAIEAARAGESGRGFAVVADEVRKLAERTAASTLEIAQTIAAMRQGAQGAVNGMHQVSTQVQRSVVLAEEASALMNRIGDSSRHAVSLVGDITHAVAEQTSASQLIAAQVEQIATMAEQGSSAASRSAQAAQEVDQLADHMRQVVSSYRT